LINEGIKFLLFCLDYKQLWIKKINFVHPYPGEFWIFMLQTFSDLIRHFKTQQALKTQSLCVTFASKERRNSLIVPGFAGLPRAPRPNGLPAPGEADS